LEAGAFLLSRVTVYLFNNAQHICFSAIQQPFHINGRGLIESNFVSYMELYYLRAYGNYCSFIAYPCRENEPRGRLGLGIGTDEYIVS
jgi:hypothetical protein